MNEEKKYLTLEEAEKIVDDMYQKRWEECGVDDGNTIHMGNLDKLQYNELEKASILLLRTELRLQQENKKLKEKLEEAEKEYDRTFGLWHNRKLIKKFDDEYDEADKKNNPERDYAYAMSDAEEVYKRYYELKDKLEASEKARKEAIELVKELKDETDDTTCYEINKNRKEMILMNLKRGKIKNEKN